MPTAKRARRRKTNATVEIPREDAAYVAACIDMSGYFGVHSDDDGSRPRQRFCLSGNEEMVRMIARLAQVGGRVFRQGTWRWEIYRGQTISNLIDIISPFVRSDRIRGQMAAIVSHQER